MHASELPEALERAMQLDHGTAVEVGSPDPITMLNLAHWIATFGDLEVVIPDEQGLSDIYLPALCPFPRIGLEEAIRLSVEA